MRDSARWRNTAPATHRSATINCALVASAANLRAAEIGSLKFTGLDGRLLDIAPLRG